MTANILYRQTDAGAIPGTTTIKHAPLTNIEMDGNIRSLVTEIDTKASTTQLNAVQQQIIDSAISMSIALG